MKVNLLSQPTYCQAFLSQDKPVKNTEKTTPVDVSLYKQSGLPVAFCGLVKGADYAEENCIRFLRKIRENRRRKFDEQDIKEMLGYLKREKDPDNKENVLREVFYLESESDIKLPSKDFLKRALKLITGRPEDERFAVLEFAQHELNCAVKPLEAFSNISEQKQNKLIKILKNINELNDIPYSAAEPAPAVESESLYDLFRVLVYAEDDISRLSGAASDKYKIDTYHLLREDLKYFQNREYPAVNIKNKVNSIAADIYNYFLDNIL